MRFLIIATLSLMPRLGISAPIEFPEDELAAESVYPVFDENIAVKKRNVVTEKHLEISGFGGWMFNDPFFSPLDFGLSLTYHFTEIHAVQLLGGLFTRTNSQYVEPLRVTTGQNYDYSPALKFFAMGAYEFTPFYGKVSVTKSTVLNLSLYLTAGGGIVSIEGEATPTLSLGIGQKIFMGPRWGILADMRGLIFQGPDPVSINLQPPPAGNVSRLPPNSAFEKKLNLNIVFNLGLLFLL